MTDPNTPHLQNLLVFEEFKAYHGKEVELLVDGQGYETGRNNNWARTTNVSIAISGKVIGETERFLNLENICVLNMEPINYRYGKGSIHKAYIIGIFEGRSKDRINE